MTEPGCAAAATVILKAVLETVARGDLGASDKLEAVLEAVLAHCIAAVARRLLPGQGGTVRRGPFVGMALAHAGAEGCIIPKLLGCYETELTPVIARPGAAGHEVIVSLGCAEGCYAVGFARRAPTARLSSPMTATPRRVVGAPTWRGGMASPTG